MQSDTTVRISKEYRARLEDEREARRAETGEKPNVRELVHEAIDSLLGGDSGGGA